MMLAALGEAALRTLLLAAVVQSLTWLLRARQPRMLFTVWAVVMAASLAMPVLQHATPLPLPIVPDFSSMVHGDLSLLDASIGPASTPEDTLTSGATLPPVLATIYLLVGGALLLRLLLGLALSWRLVCRATPVCLDWTEGVRVRISQDVTAPVTFGNVVLLPPDATDWCTATRAAVMAHERAHVERRDFAVLLASQLHRTVFWFSPVSWWLHRRLASLAELASDDRAMAATGDRPGYAATLLEMGRRSGPLLRGLAMARPATLVHRIERSLGEQTQPAQAGPTLQLGLAFAVTILSVMAAGPRLDPGSQAVPAPMLVFASTVKIGDTDVERNSAETRPTIVASPSTPTLKQAALLSAPFVTQEQRETLSPPKHSRSPLTAIARTDPAIPRAAARKAMRSAETLHDFARPVAASIKELGTATSVSIRSASTEGSSSAHAIERRTPGDSQTRLVGDAPSCTGRYVPKLASTPDGEQLEMIEARYLQASDGSEAVKISLGIRVRTKLTGMDVERASVRATVVTRLPTGTGLLTGTMVGLNGTLEYQCRRIRT